MAKNVLQKHWNGTEWKELLPVTRTGNVYSDNGETVENRLVEIEESVKTSKDKEIADLANTINELSLSKASIEDPVFLGVPKVGNSRIIHESNLSNFINPPINYDGQTNELVIHVNADTGNDSNDGLTNSRPKKTIAAAMQLLPKVSPRRRVLAIIGNFNESVSFSNFVGGEIGILCYSTGTNSAKIKGLRFELCNVAKYQVYNLRIGDFNSSNLVDYYAFSFRHCSGGYAQIGLVNLDVRTFGFLVEYSSVNFHLDIVKIISVTGGTIGDGFYFRNAGSAFLTGCSSPTQCSTGLVSMASIVYADITNILGSTKTSKSQGGQIFTFV